MELHVTNVNQALSRGLEYLRLAGVVEESRNGKVLVAPGPVMTVYMEPCERVLFSPKRDANPFFHYMEAMWMLAGRNNVDFPARFAKQINNYSDDGKTLHGAYGYRWRKKFGFDQLNQITFELKNNPNSRRCVLAMWDATHVSEFLPVSNKPPFEEEYSDLFIARWGGKDVPCNTHVYFDVRGGVLNMTVLCRSNDIIWGAYGANAVHFSVLQEYMAAKIGIPVGLYRQFSNNYHLYFGVCGIVDADLSLVTLADNARHNDLYEDLQTKATPLFDDIETFDAELAKFMHDPETLRYYNNKALRLAKWMYAAWTKRKEKTGNGLAEIEEMPTGDWERACRAWINRREKGKEVDSLLDAAR